MLSWSIIVVVIHFICWNRYKSFHSKIIVRKSLHLVNTTAQSIGEHFCANWPTIEMEPCLRTLLQNCFQTAWLFQTVSEGPLCGSSQRFYFSSQNWLPQFGSNGLQMFLNQPFRGCHTLAGVQRSQCSLAKRSGWNTNRQKLSMFLWRCLQIFSLSLRQGLSR